MNPVEDKLIELLNRNRIINTPETKFHDPTGELDKKITYANEMLDDCIETVKEYFKNRFIIQMNRGDQIEVLMSSELFKNFIDCCSQISEVQKVMSIDEMNIDPVEGSGTSIYIGQINKEKDLYNKDDAVMFLFSGENETPNHIITKSNIINLADYSDEVKKFEVVQDLNKQIDSVLKE